MNLPTEYALTYLFNNISCAMDNKEFTVVIFMDLSRAFDTVKHIFLEKLLHYAVRGTALSWLKSYLNSRQQFVEFNGQ